MRFFPYYYLVFRICVGRNLIENFGNLFVVVIVDHFKKTIANVAVELGQEKNVLVGEENVPEQNEPRVSRLVHVRTVIIEI